MNVVAPVCSISTDPVLSPSHLQSTRRLLISVLHVHPLFVMNCVSADLVEVNNTELMNE